MGDLSKDFSEWEFTCKCCGVTIVDPRLVEALQELRDNLGKKITITPNGGYRCPINNARRKGRASRSQHLYGRAVDIQVGGMKPKEVLVEVRKVPAFYAGGIGLYSQFVHCDVRQGKRPARWGGAKRRDR
jgi:uncharacterized protein YcbK (DUF882 family)